MQNRYSENGAKCFLCLVKKSFSPNKNFFPLLEINLAQKGLKVKVQNYTTNIKSVEIN